MLSTIFKGGNFIIIENRWVDRSFNLKTYTLKYMSETSQKKYYNYRLSQKL